MMTLRDPENIDDVPPPLPALSCRESPIRVPKALKWLECHLKAIVGLLEVMIL